MIDSVVALLTVWRQDHFLTGQRVFREIRAGSTEPHSRQVGMCSRWLRCSSMPPCADFGRSFTRLSIAALLCVCGDCTSNNAKTNEKNEIFHIQNTYFSAN